jgi:hypothetical protein
MVGCPTRKRALLEGAAMNTGNSRSTLRNGLQPSAIRRAPKPDWRPVPVSADLARLIEARDRTRCDPRLAPFAEAASLALAQARHARACAFGARYGWRPSAAAFGVEDFCGPVLVGRRWLRREDWNMAAEIRGMQYPLFDHRWYFRRRGKPAAIVANPYAPAFKLETAQALARASGLKVRIEDDIESWYNDKCIVVVWTKAL